MISREASRFPHDPELDEPGAEAVAAVVSEAENDDPEPSGLSAAIPSRPVPVITPADPTQWQKVVPLERSLNVDGERLDTITVKCLSGDDFVNIIMSYGTEANVVLSEIRGAMCGLHPDVIAALATDDQARVVAACRPFLPRLLQDAPDATEIIISALENLAD